MMILITLLLVLFLIINTTVYFLGHAIYLLYNKLISNSENNYPARTMLAATILITCTALYTILFTSPAKNDEVAYMRAVEDGFVIKATGARMLMAHDPVSALMRRTYKDSVEIFIPRNQGIIKAEELPNPAGSYKQLCTITIQDSKLKINLFYNDTDDGVIKPESWNGEYKLMQQMK